MQLFACLLVHTSLLDTVSINNKIKNTLILLSVWVASNFGMCRCTSHGMPVKELVKENTKYTGGRDRRARGIMAPPLFGKCLVAKD